MKNRVTILLSSYNHAKFIEKCLDSIIAQSYENWQLWILDDNSTDDTLDILNKYAALDDRVKILNDGTNKGKAKRLNEVLPEIDTQYIALLDSDDAWKSSNLEDKIRILNEGDYDVVISDADLIDSRDLDFKLVDKAWPRDLKNKRFWDIHRSPQLKEGNMHLDLIQGNFIFYGSVVFNRKLLKQNRFDENIVRSIDWLFFIDIFYNANCYVIEESLCFYRIHGNNLQNTINNSSKRHAARLKVIDNHGSKMTRIDRQLYYYRISRGYWHDNDMQSSLYYLNKAIKEKVNWKLLIIKFYTKLWLTLKWG